MTQSLFEDKSILIVDDEPMMRKLIGRSLQRKLNPKTVVEAGDGHEALMKMANQEFNLIIIDLQMPKIGGLELIRELRTKARFKDIPIIVVSGAIEEKGVQEIVRWGVRNILAKPFHPSLLFKSIGELLNAA